MCGWSNLTCTFSQLHCHAQTNFQNPKATQAKTATMLEHSQLYVKTGTIGCYGRKAEWLNLQVGYGVSKLIWDTSRWGKLCQNVRTLSSTVQRFER